MTTDPKASMNEPDPLVAPPRRWRLQFSLATLMWLTTLACCLLAIWAMYRDLQQTKAEARAQIEQAQAELQAARNEVQKYRGEMGYLIIADAKKLYARGITTRPNKWSWRVYLPPGRLYEIPVLTVGIPETGLPSSASDAMVNLEPGEHIIDAAVEEGHNGKWHLHIVISDNIMPRIWDEEIQPIRQDSHSIGGVFERAQQAADPQSGLILLQARKCKSQGGSYVSDPQPCDGLMIWIKEMK
jgi:hypothetical protein